MDHHSSRSTVHDDDDDDTPVSASGRQPMNFDRLLEAAGDTGVYQITLFLLISVMEFVAIDSFSINFIAARMDHWCRVDGLSNVSFVDQRNLAVPPRNEKPSPTGYSQCLRYDPITAAAVGNMSSWNVSMETVSDANVDEMTTVSGRRSIECDDGWTYDRSMFVSTIVSEWDLVCDRAWLIDLVSAVYMVGRLVACMCCGSIADRFGRKPTVLVFHGIKFVGSVLSIYAPYYWLFVVSRFIIAVGSTASNLATFLIVSEISGKRYRSTFGIGWSLMLAFGTVLMPGIAYLVRDWRTLQSIYTWPQIVLLAYIFLLDESPRWLIVKRRVKEAMVILHKVAAVNRRNLPIDVTVDVPPLTSADARRSRFCECSIGKLVATPNLRKWSLILWLNWFTASLMYYALSLNAGRLPGDIFVNMFLLAVVEIPANLIALPLLERAGRRLTLSVSMLLAGVSSLLMIPFMFIEGADIAVTSFGVLGKALITIAYSSAYIVTTETYPTDVRAVGMGVSTSFARFSSLFGSFVGGVMTEKWRPLPSVIFGALGLVSGGLAFLLPETKNKNLPSTVEEAEHRDRREVYVEELLVEVPNKDQNSLLLGRGDDKKEPAVSTGNGACLKEVAVNESLLASDKCSPLIDQKL